ncbi:hypothetical protein BH23BAC4_BH23BAC4_02950 [soil metagenome]
MTRASVLTALASGSPIRHEIIVVDNASPDDSAKRLVGEFAPCTYPNINIIALQENLGFSKANNIGADISSGDILFFLNPDTLVHNHAIPKLVYFINTRDGVGAVGPKILNPDGSIQESILRFPSVNEILSQNFPTRLDLSRSSIQKGAHSLPSVSPVDAVKGCALALRRDVFFAAGGWDESYFMYTEETELCHTLKQIGKVNYFYPDARVTHYGGAASKENYVSQQIMERRSYLAFLHKHEYKHLIAINRIAGTVGYAMRSAVFPLLALIDRGNYDSYKLRGQSALSLLRWFAWEYK